MLSRYPAPVRLQLWAPSLLCQSFSRLLERLPQFQLTSDTASTDVLLAIELQAPAASFRAAPTHLPVALVLPSSTPGSLTESAARWHALALLTLEDDLETLAEGIEAAFSRRSFRSPRLKAAPRGGTFQPLSQSESEVTRWVCTGLSNAQIAEEMHLSEGTIKSHLVHIFRKLELQRRSQLIAWCQKSNFS